ncbi:integrase family protein [Mesorhizobium sp. M1169]|uniref:tyrosine-type recombinase/integrase n=1 Tax=Mesorhizobium sp. M1169 TaxID=2957066 RepID=UPI003335B3B3
MPKAKLTTKGAVEALPPPEKAQEHYWCTDLRGFGVVVGAKNKTFVVQRDVNGKSRRVAIGRYGDITLDQARKKAEQLMGQMRGGVDPTGRRKAAAANNMTLRDALEKYERYLVAKERSPRTGAGYRANLQRYCSDWLDRPMAEITRTAANARHHLIGDRNGKHAANQTMRALSAIWRRIGREYPALDATPTVNVDFYPEPPRTAVIPYAQLPEWWAGVHSIKNPIRRDLYIWFLFTGTRREESASLRWSQVDLDAGTVHFPRTKTDPFTLPLSDFLVDLLRVRRSCESTLALFGKDCEFVFPARTRTGKIGHVTEPKLNENEVALFPCPWTPHTLRHTFVSIAENKVSIPATHGRLLVNHALAKSGDAHSGYNHPDFDDLKRSQQLVTNALRTAIWKFSYPQRPL